ncbi:DUF2484 family protein [Planktotalea sp.]
MSWSLTMGAIYVLVAAMSVLRWPVIYLVKWVNRLFG